MEQNNIKTLNCCLEEPQFDELEHSKHSSESDNENSTLNKKYKNPLDLDDEEFMSNSNQNLNVFNINNEINENKPVSLEPSNIKTLVELFEANKRSIEESNHKAHLLLPNIPETIRCSIEPCATRKNNKTNNQSSNKISESDLKYNIENINPNKIISSKSIKDLLTANNESIQKSSNKKLKKKSTRKAIAKTPIIIKNKENEHEDIHLNRVNSPCKYKSLNEIEVEKALTEEKIEEGEFVDYAKFINLTANNIKEETIQLPSDIISNKHFKKFLKNYILMKKLLSSTSMKLASQELKQFAEFWKDLNGPNKFIYEGAKRVGEIIFNFSNEYASLSEYIPTAENPSFTFYTTEYAKEDTAFIQEEAELQKDDSEQDIEYIRMVTDSDECESNSENQDDIEINSLDESSMNKKLILNKESVKPSMKSLHLDEVFDEANKENIKPMSNKKQIKESIKSLHSDEMYREPKQILKKSNKIVKESIKSLHLDEVFNQKENIPSNIIIIEKKDTEQSIDGSAFYDVLKVATTDKNLIQRQKSPTANRIPGLGREDKSRKVKSLQKDIHVNNKVENLVKNYTEFIKNTPERKLKESTDAILTNDIFIKQKISKLKLKESKDDTSRILATRESFKERKSSKKIFLEEQYVPVNKNQSPIKIKKDEKPVWKAPRIYTTNLLTALVR